MNMNFFSPDIVRYQFLLGLWGFNFLKELIPASDYCVYMARNLQTGTVGLTYQRVSKYQYVNKMTDLLYPFIFQLGCCWCKCCKCHSRLLQCLKTQPRGSWSMTLSCHSFLQFHVYPCIKVFTKSQISKKDNNKELYRIVCNGRQTRREFQINNKLWAE